MSTTTIFPSEVIPDLLPLPECPSWFRQELYENAKNIAIIIVLGLINAIVILGNLLVVMAVFASAKLRTVTNFLIVSLAISDLLVGLAVLPYSISLEVLEFWIFGELWCQMWLAVDVWLCTASILNLCAISIDRYLAITRPVHYRSIMSTKRVRLLIAAVWVLSFIICFPPLVGWNDRVKDDDGFLPLLDANATQPLFRNFNYTTLRSINNFTDDSNATSIEEVRYILRNATSRRCYKPQCGLITTPGYVIYSALGSFYIPMLVMLFFYYRIYVVALKTSRALDRGFKSTKSTKRKKGSGGSSQEGGSAGPSDVTLRIHRGRPTNESMPSSSHSRSGDILVPRRIPTVVYHHSRDCSSATNSPRCFREDSTKQYYTAAAKPSPSSELTVEDGNPPRNGRASLFSKSNSSSSSSSKRQARWHAKRFRTEAKATKTVGIIVGGFILCWLPFFTVYLIVGFCEPCIPKLLFKVFFYLGYCNSALNPIIYGIISKDFRFAFRKILCRCTLNDDSVASLIRHIHMPTFIEENPPTESTSGHTT